MPFRPTRPPAGRLVRLGVVLDPDDRAMFARRAVRSGGDAIVWLADRAGLVTDEHPRAVIPIADQLVRDLERASLGLVLARGERLGDVLRSGALSSLLDTDRLEVAWPEAPADPPANPGTTGHVDRSSWPTWAACRRRSPSPTISCWPPGGSRTSRPRPTRSGPNASKPAETRRPWASRRWSRRRSVARRRRQSRGSPRTRSSTWQGTGSDRDLRDPGGMPGPGHRSGPRRVHRSGVHRPVDP